MRGVQRPKFMWQHQLKREDWRWRAPRVSRRVGGAGRGATMKEVLSALSQQALFAGHRL